MNISSGLLIAAQTQNLQRPSAAGAVRPAFTPLQAPPVEAAKKANAPEPEANTPQPGPLRPGSLLDIKI